MNEIKFDGNKLFKIRREKNISQEKLAESVGVTRQTIYLWESNQTLPDIEKVIKICETLKIDINDLIDKDLDENKEKQPEVKSSNNKKFFIKLIFIIILVIILIYFLICNFKFIRLNNILKKYNKSDFSNSYYIKVEEYSLDEKGLVLDKFCYEKYLKDGVLETVINEKDSNNIASVIISDFNNNEKYIINEENKTYVKEKLGKNENTSLTSNLPNIIKFDKNMFLNYIYCFNPYFSIKDEGMYILKIKDSIKENINKKTGLIEYEESYDKNGKNFKRYYEIITDIDNDFPIKLEDYTEER